MSIIKETIKADIESAFKAVMNDTSDDREGAIGRVADKIADAVVKAIKSSTIVYETGLIAPPAGGPVTGLFKGKLQ